LRASLIIGKGGSSFNILENLIKRLPALALPTWTQNKCQPVDVKDVCQAIFQILEQSTFDNQTYDLVGPTQLTYEELLRLTAKKMDKKRYFFKFPFVPLKLSKFWVSLITGAPNNLVYPLVESLKHEMISRSEKKFKANFEYVSLESSLHQALAAKRETVSQKIPNLVQKINLESLGNVISVQRLSLPQGKDCEWVADTYMRWLPKYFKFVVSVSVRDFTCTFKLLGLIKLLVLELSSERSFQGRKLFYITGGILNKDTGLRGRLEFRASPNKKNIIAAIFDFRPSLPWFIYRYSQALVHLYVMRRFGEYLRRRLS
jgi:hypothetical protein